MKVIEQLVQHLSEVGALNGADVAWLREQGFLPSLDGEYSRDDSDETMETADRETLEDPLEQLQERRIQDDQRRVGRGPSKGSRGARRKRGNITDNRAAAAQRRTIRRIADVGENASTVGPHPPASAIPALVAGLDHEDEDVFVTAQGVLRKLGPRGVALIEGLIAELRATDRKRKTVLERALNQCRIGAKAHVFENGMGMKFLRIPAGHFIDGSPLHEPTRRGASKLSNGVTITKAFYLGLGLVTNQQWHDVMASRPLTDKFRSSAHSARCVDWHEAVDYCGKLSKLERARYRLPTEAEWEYGRRYALVTGLRKAELFGSYSLDAALWEWCRDWFQDPKSILGIDPQGPTIGTHKVLRNGREFDFPEIDSPWRIPAEPNRSNMERDAFSFRVCLEIV
jgi:formylglycine-generating enzyme required for sulfatase activity